MLQAEVQRIKTTEGISYAEAVKKVTGDTQISKQKDTMYKETKSCNGCDQLKEETLIVKKILVYSWWR